MGQHREHGHHPGLVPVQQERNADGQAVGEVMRYGHNQNVFVGESGRQRTHARKQHRGSGTVEAAPWKLCGRQRMSGCYGDLLASATRFKMAVDLAIFMSVATAGSAAACASPRTPSQLASLYMTPRWHVGMSVLRECTWTDLPWPWRVAVWPCGDGDRFA